MCAMMMTTRWKLTTHRRSLISVKRWDTAGAELVGHGSALAVRIDLATQHSPLQKCVCIDQQVCALHSQCIQMTMVRPTHMNWLFCCLRAVMQGRRRWASAVDGAEKHQSYHVSQPASAAATCVSAHHSPALTHLNAGCGTTPTASHK